MEKLFQFSASRINSVDITFKRYLWNKINWNNRLIAITGGRGVGKTTLLLQYIRENLNDTPDEVIYANMDDLYFSGLKIVVTGSSALDVYKGNADLSRRAVLHKMHGLSLREFIALKYHYHFPVYTLDHFLNKPEKIYLNNPNLIDSLADARSNPGTLKETFFINQMRVLHTVSGSNKGDFLVDGKYTFEIGGKSKNLKQTAGVKNAFVAADNIEYAQQNKIPLWLFGFLY